MRLPAFPVAAVASLLLAACGGEDESRPQEPLASGECAPIEEVSVEPFGDHAERRFEAGDYPTNPPAGGPHNPEALAPGRYRDPQPLGEAVHLLEHGAVIGWTNELPPDELAAVEEAFDEAQEKGYFQVATVENPELGVPFALSAWGAFQRCEEADTTAIEQFLAEWYASPKSGEANLACAGPAGQLPPCQAQQPAVPS